ncbi:MAG: DUF5916 domain-containing protein [Saprospiraceae bacterium]
MKTALLSCLLLVAASLFAQHRAPEDHVMHIKRTAAPISIDGVLDEPAWQMPQNAEAFHLNFPTDTGFAKWPTVFQVAFDDRYFYVAAICKQNRADYTVQSLKRDYAAGTSDGVNLLLDPTKDGLNGFLFGLNPLGVQREGLIDNGANLSFDWDNKWVSAVKNHDDHWTLEMAIPFKTLRYTVSPGENSWRINFIRTKLKDWEVSAWSPVPQQFSPNNVAFCGTLIWDEPPPKPSLNVSLIPYVNTGYSVSYVRDENTLEVTEKPSDFTRAVGGDAKIAVTSGLNLDLTFNPDFSQVEVDQQVANLQRFELFFPERRQFFLENRDLFAMFGFPQTRPFFSRRIGLARNTVTRNNETVPILGGARLSGKLNDKWRIGLLNMQTQQKRWGPESVLPAANFTVATAQRKMFGRSALSGILVNKQNFLSKLNNVERGDFQNWNRVAGLEYNLYSKDNRWEGEWYWHRSFSPDKDREGQTFAHFLGYSVRNFNTRFGYWYVDGNYDSEAGFVPRNGVQGMYPGFNWVWWPQSDVLNSVSLGADGDLTFNLDWKSTDRDVNLYTELSFKDQSNAWAGIYHNYTYLFDAFDPTNLYREPDDPLPADSGYVAHGFYAGVNTSTSYDLQGNLEVTAGEFFNGHIVSVEGFISYRIQPIGLLSMGYSYNAIRLPEPHASADVFLLGPKAELSFSRKLFVSGFFQYNTQANNFNINARLQWRFAPASDVFLVYTDNSFAERIENTPVRFLSPKNKAMVLKVVYWLNV